MSAINNGKAHDQTTQGSFSFGHGNAWQDAENKASYQESSFQEKFGRLETSTIIYCFHYSFKAKHGDIRIYIYIYIYIYI